jgi:sn-glycerol 3-phosphate transport system permease protein
MAVEATEVGREGGRALRTAGWYLLLIVLAGIVLFPVYMTFVRAISTPVSYINEGTPIYPVDVQWDVFQRAFSDGGLGEATMISLVVTLAITASQVITSALAAYAFVFLRFPLKNVLFALFMATLLLPLEVTFIANVQTVRNDFGWGDSIQGLVVPFMATAFGTFLMRQGFRGIPPEIRDATRLDGYGHLKFLWKFAIPLTKPVIASFTVISFLGAWNQYLWPRAIIDNPDNQTLQIALQTLANGTPEQANIAVAGALIAAVPILFLLIFFQRHIVRGLTAGAVKG